MVKAIKKKYIKKKLKKKKTRRSISWCLSIHKIHVPISSLYNCALFTFRSVYELWGQGENLTALKENLLQYPPDKMVNGLPIVVVVVLVVKIVTIHFSVLCRQEISL